MSWTESPCASCQHTPCCSHLPLHSFRIDSLSDWEKAGKLLEFSGIRLGIRSDGEFRLYLNRACPNLMKDKRCAIHDTPIQSRICMSYSPYTCWYKRAFSEKSSPLLILLDRNRWSLIGSLLVWNSIGELDYVPPWENLCQSVDRLTINIDPVPFSSSVSHGEGDLDFLLFPPGKPMKKEHWDLVRFKLSFPGVYLSQALDESAPWAFLIARPGFNPIEEFEVKSRGWDPFETGHDPLNADLIDIDGLNLKEKLIKEG